MKSCPPFRHYQTYLSYKAHKSYKAYKTNKANRPTSNNKKGKMENPYIKQFPRLMAGKKILYVHGFGSSGQSGTVSKIREMLPGATVVAPDLPIHPEEAMALLRETCGSAQPDLIIGTSMGGMYTEMLRGYDRILVNPALRMADTMHEHGMMGKQVFSNPRQDGMQEFIVTKALVKEYRAMTDCCFNGVDDEERGRVWGLFGDEDTTVNNYMLFSEHYPQAVSFHGGHRLIDKSLIHAVMPVVQWIDDRQEGRERPTVYISIDSLRDSRGGQMSSAVKAFNFLFENYSVYIVAPAPSANPEYITKIQQWTQEFINVPAYNHVIYTNRNDLLYGDYLIDPVTKNGTEAFMGTVIRFGDDTFKTWEEIIEFFDRLGGQ